MIRLAARTLRHRVGGFVAAFVAMFLGAAIVMACGALMETGIRTAVPPQQLAGTDVVIAGDQHVEVPGLQYTAVVSERVRIDAGLVDVVSALPGVQEAGAHVFDHPAPEGTVDAIGVVAEAGVSVEELREAIDVELAAVAADGGSPDGGAAGPAVTLTGDDRGLAEVPQAALAADGLISLAGVFGAMALMVSVFGVASMLALSVQQRHREMALLRAVGSTPGQLRQLVLGETVLLAAVAAVVAIAPGRWLGGAIFEGMVGAGLVVEGVAFRMGWLPMVIAIAAALLAAAGGALVAGGQAAKTRPTQALAASGMPQRRRLGVWRILFGLLFLAGGAVLAALTMTVLSGELASATGMPAVIVLAIGLALLSPVLTRPLAAILRPFGALSGQPGRLAMLNVRAGIDRAASVVMPIILLSGIAVGLVYMQFTEQSAVQQEYADALVADAVLTGEESIEPGLAERVNDLPGVAAASEYAQSTGHLEQPVDDPVRWDGDPRWDGWMLQGATPEDAATVVSASAVDGSFDDLRGDAVALDADNAAELGIAVGDPLTVRMGDNTALQAEVVALYEGAPGDATLLLPADVLAAHTTQGSVSEILVVGDGSISAEQLIAGLTEFAAGEAGLGVASRDALIGAYAETQETLSFATDTIVVVIVTYTAISVINALASSTQARRREFALQRLTGSTRGQVLRMLTVEGVAVSVIGVLLGTIAAVAATVPFSIGRAGTLYPAGSPWIYAGVVAGSVLLVLLATLVPGWQATRQRPIHAVAVD